MVLGERMCHASPLPHPATRKPRVSGTPFGAPHLNPNTFPTSHEVGYKIPSLPRLQSGLRPSETRGTGRDVFQRRRLHRRSWSQPQAPCVMWRAQLGNWQLTISHTTETSAVLAGRFEAARKNCGRNSAGRIYVPAVQAGNFKKCCLKSGQFDGANRNYFQR